MCYRFSNAGECAMDDTEFIQCALGFGSETGLDGPNFRANTFCMHDVLSVNGSCVGLHEEVVHINRFVRYLIDDFSERPESRPGRCLQDDPLVCGTDLIFEQTVGTVFVCLAGHFLQTISKTSPILSWATHAICRAFHAFMGAV